MSSEAYLGRLGNSEDPKLRDRVFSFLRSGRKPRHDGVGREVFDTSIPKELLIPNAHLLTDVLPHTLTDPNPFNNADVEEIMRWTKSPEVAGHVYQLEDDQDLYRGDRRKSMYIDYYQGWKDDEGKPTKPEDSIFLKGINDHNTMLANTRLRADGVPFIRGENIMEWERLLVVPEHLQKKIGLGFSIYTMDTALFRYKYQNGEPAEEVRASVYVDVPAARNLGLLHLLGFEGHGSARQINGRWIQPLRLFPNKYITARPRAIDHLSAAQPQWAQRLEKDGEQLQINKQ